MGYGAFFWGLGVLAVRHAGPHMFHTNLGRCVTAVASLPAVYMLVPITEALLSLKSQESLPAMALATGVACILDGIAHTWFPTAYENPALQKKNPLAACVISRYGSGWLLYLVGIFLTMLVFK
ncbi:unnamed protein product [Rotaria sp. Silwood2]|nr:unnamed protein product [Rotaria sp. Silwood2]CAF3084140.1 unnamed protein product [Rotaria sp. Silwood2]CAF3380998.1 unnamed protein product [Rotaria sp. Silwood2]CAF3467554.1 unnamed protein product [Rotaria sp. Silwood2]CAF4354051.1 unnamed protein product [Rotaria sp. Silwood2]